MKLKKVREKNRECLHDGATVANELNHNSFLIRDNKHDGNMQLCIQVSPNYVFKFSKSECFGRVRRRSLEVNRKCCGTFPI